MVSLFFLWCFSFLAEMPGVISIFPNRAHQLHTTRSWEFLGLQHPSGAVSPHSLWKKAKYGDGVIVGLLDTGKDVLTENKTKKFK